MAELFNNRKLHAVIFFILLFPFFIYVFIPSVNKINTDFPNYYVSANMFLDGKDLKQAYDNVAFNKQLLLYGINNQIVSFVPYPPVNAMLLVGLARLEPLTSKLVWNSLNFIFFLICVYFISKISGLNYFLSGILFFVSGYAFVNNFFFGQAYLLVLMLFSGSVHYLLKGKDITAAFLFSLSILLKFYTVFFLILFLCRKKFRMVTASIAFFLLFNLIVIFITGWDINYYYYSTILPRVSDGWVGTVYVSEFQSVTSLLHRLFYSEPSLNPDPLMESPQLYFLFKYFFYFGILISSVYTVWYSRNNKDPATFKLQISLFCFICLLLLPVNASYQYVILIKAIAILSYHYISVKNYFTVLILLSLFFIMNSPLAVYIIGVTKDKPYFYLGYIKLFILLFFWLNNIILLRSLAEKKIAVRSKLRYSFVYVLLILIFSRLSLARENTENDGAENVLINPNYLISMPDTKNEKIIFTECQNERFILNSNFGLSYNKENIFDPEFSGEDEIKYTTIKDRQFRNKKLNINTYADSQESEPEDKSSFDLSKDGSKKCYSKDGQIFLEDFKSGITKQVTSGNSFNTRPAFYEKDSGIIFCSDRKRGVGFTTLYEIKINH